MDLLSSRWRTSKGRSTKRKKQLLENLKKKVPVFSDNRDLIGTENKDLLLDVSKSKESDGRKNRSKTIPTPSKIPDTSPIKDASKPPDSEKATEPEPEIIPSITSQVVITEKMFNDLYRTVCTSLHDVTVYLTPNLKLVIKKDMPDNSDTTPEPPMNSPSKLPSGSLLEPNVIIKEEIVEVEDSSKYDDTCDMLHSSSTAEPSSSENNERTSSFIKHSSTNKTEQMEWSSNLLESSSCSSDQVKVTYNYLKRGASDSSNKTDWTSNLSEPNSSRSSQEINWISNYSKLNKQDFSPLNKYPYSSAEQREATYSNLLKPSCSYSPNEITETSHFSSQNAPNSHEQTNWTSNLMTLSSSSSEPPENTYEFSKQNDSFSERTERIPFSSSKTNPSSSREQVENFSSFSSQNYPNSSDSSFILPVPIDWTCRSPKQNFPDSSEQIERTSQAPAQNISNIYQQTE